VSGDDVYKYEMPRSQPSDDQWPAGDPALAAFAEDLRIIAAGPAPEPRPGLVAVMTQVGSSVPIDSSPGRRKMLVKTLVGSLAAKVAFGMGVAAASVTAAGAAGVLPDPAQHAVASVVSAATPFVLPDPSAVSLQVTGDTTTTSSSTSSTSTTVAGTPTTLAGDGEADGSRTLNHGACVSAVAKAKTDEESHGKTVSSVARSDCGKTDSSTTSTTVAGGSTTSSSTSTTIAGGDERSPNSGPGNSGNRGNSGSGNSNSGNGGRGNPGRG
jgi:hypothetical protein